MEKERDARKALAEQLEEARRQLAHAQHELAAAQSHAAQHERSLIHVPALAPAPPALPFDFPAACRSIRAASPMVEMGHCHACSQVRYGPPWQDGEGCDVVTLSTPANNEEAGNNR